MSPCLPIVVKCVCNHRLSHPAYSASMPSARQVRVSTAAMLSVLPLPSPAPPPPRLAPTAWCIRASARGYTAVVAVASPAKPAPKLSAAPPSPPPALNPTAARFNCVAKRTNHGENPGCRLRRACTQDDGAQHDALLEPVAASHFRPPRS